MDLMLTEKQIRVLRYFRDYRREKGIAPTLDEAAQALGVSKITIHEHLNQLSRKGAIHRDKAKARAVAILHDPDAPDGPVQESAVPSLPLLGSIAKKFRETSMSLPFSVSRLAASAASRVKPPIKTDNLRKSACSSPESRL